MIGVAVWEVAVGYGIIPYAVSVDVLRSPHTHCADPEDFLAWVQNLYCSDDEDEIGPTRESLREVFYADTPDEAPAGTEGYVYGYGLKALCERFGAYLPNGHWYPFGSGWLPMVRDGLTEVGVRFDPEDLIYSGSPVRLPSIDDFPLIGHLRRAELKPVAEALDAADLSVIGERAVADAIAELHGWLRLCVEADEEDYDLVCFYH